MALLLLATPPTRRDDTEAILAFLRRAVRYCECDDAELLREAMRGAHVRLRDGGELYAWAARGLGHANTRLSSHASRPGTSQYELAGRVGALLFGLDQDGTWFQLERAPLTRGLLGALAHGRDYVQYALTGRQVGPLGTSARTDERPVQCALSAAARSERASTSKRVP